MDSSNAGVKQANWQVTATTMECSLVKEFVTVLVNKDWTCKCVWWFKHCRDGSAKGLNTKAKTTACRGPDCRYVQQYRDKLRQEEEIDNR